MTNSKSLRDLGLALACVAITFSLSVCAQAQTVTFIYDFHASGQQSSALSVIQGTDGNLYGTAGGGSHDQGRVFRLTSTGELTTIYSFCSQPNCADGESQEPMPILGSDGNLYGVATFGGNATGSGTFYKLTLEGQFIKLYTFCSAPACADGQWPHGFIQGRDGNFYGTTESGGANNSGALYQLSPSGGFKVLYSFCSLPKCIDGGTSNIIQGIDGKFYGTAGTGTLGGGYLYQITPDGSFNMLYNFCLYTNANCNSGSYPSAIVQDAKGNFFGTTAYGGANGGGTVFEITPKYQFHMLHGFGVHNQASDPIFGVTLANDGNLYGTSADYGYDGGRLFEVTPKGVYTELYSFQSGNGGYDPFWAPPFQGTDGLLYGTTLYDAGTCCYGTIFSLSNGIHPLVETVPTGGKAGQQVLILGNGLTGSTSVKFNGVAAKFTVESDTYIKAAVPKGATTGTVSVVTPSGTLNSNPQFVVTK
jgi:uncharacterized repeat protein (TIGR03803 family)